MEEDVREGVVSQLLDSLGLYNPRFIPSIRRRDIEEIRLMEDEQSEPEKEEEEEAEEISYDAKFILSLLFNCFPSLLEKAETIF